jgi:hypothetical protein
MEISALMVAGISQYRKANIDSVAENGIVGAGKTSVPDRNHSICEARPRNAKLCRGGCVRRGLVVNS